MMGPAVPRHEDATSSMVNQRAGLRCRLEDGVDAVIAEPAGRTRTKPAREVSRWSGVVFVLLMVVTFVLMP
jgi:hypothetical protein